MGSKFPIRLILFLICFFTDDNIIFCRVQDKESKELKIVLTPFDETSTQIININKYVMIYNKKVREEEKDKIRNW